MSRSHAFPIMTALSMALLVMACKRDDSNSSPPSEANTELAPEAAPPIEDDGAGGVDAAQIVAAPDRDPADLEADTRRKPVELLESLRLEPGMKVADIGAGFGYTTELLARAVSPEGRVYGHNTPFVLDRFAREGWTQRLAKPVNQNVVALERARACRAGRV